METHQPTNHPVRDDILGLGLDSPGPSTGQSHFLFDVWSRDDFVQWRDAHTRCQAACSSASRPKKQAFASPPRRLSAPQPATQTAPLTQSRPRSPSTTRLHQLLQPLIARCAYLLCTNPLLTTDLPAPSRPLTLQTPRALCRTCATTPWIRSTSRATASRRCARPRLLLANMTASRATRSTTPPMAATTVRFYACRTSALAVACSINAHANPIIQAHLQLYVSPVHPWLPPASRR